MQSAEPGIRSGSSPPADQGRTSVAEVAAAVEREASYLRIVTSAPDSEGWLRSADLLDAPAVLAESIRATGLGLGAPEDQVAASLWFQGYAFRVAIPVLAPYALGISGLSVDPASTHIRIARNRPAAVAVTSGVVMTRSPVEAATDLLADHLGPMVEAVASTVTVGRRLLWGNAAASCATVFRALEGAPGAQRNAIRARADGFVQAAAPWFDGLGHFGVVSEAGREGWYWTRTSCCLWDHCDGASRCDDCSLTPASELDQARRDELRRAPEVAAP